MNPLTLFFNGFSKLWNETICKVIYYQNSKKKLIGYGSLTSRKSQKNVFPFFKQFSDIFEHINFGERGFYPFFKILWFYKNNW